jgi:hypothetical protein
MTADPPQQGRLCRWLGSCDMSPEAQFAPARRHELLHQVDRRRPLAGARHLPPVSE